MGCELIIDILKTHNLDVVLPLLSFIDPNEFESCLLEKYPKSRRDINKLTNILITNGYFDKIRNQVRKGGFGNTNLKFGNTNLNMNLKFGNTNLKFGNKFGKSVNYVNATRQALKMVLKNNLDPNAIKGTGISGKITKHDVESYLRELKSEAIYDKLTDKALKEIIRNNLNPNEIRGTGKYNRITKGDVSKYIKEKEKWDMVNFFKRTGIRTAIILVLGYFLKVGTFPFTRTGAINRQALKDLTKNSQYPKLAKAAKDILNALDMGLNPKFLKIMEKDNELSKTGFFKQLKKLV